MVVSVEVLLPGVIVVGVGDAVVTTVVTAGSFSPAAFAASRALVIASRIPSELNVAPETASTSVDCRRTTVFISDFARLKKEASSSVFLISIFSMVPFLKVRETLVSPRYPMPMPS